MILPPHHRYALVHDAARRVSESAVDEEACRNEINSSPIGSFARDLQSHLSLASVIVRMACIESLSGLASDDSALRHLLFRLLTNERLLAIPE